MYTAHNLKEIRGLHNLTQEEFATALGLTRELVNKMEKGKCRISKGSASLIQRFVEERQSENHSHELDILGKPPVRRSASAAPYHQQLLQKKNEAAAPMVPLVGIKAQAGYVKGYEQVDFIDTLEKYSLPPGLKAGGAQWSYFEVEGDSMEPTFAAGDVILGSVVHFEDWQDLKDFCVYVILTDESLLVKRVFKKSATEWVLISDNEELHPQKLLAVSSIKEVWTFRRHIRSCLPSRPVSITV